MNKYIDYFELKEEYHGVKPFKCPFKEGVNVVVGENGSGKSTMLNLMADKKELGIKPDFFKIKLVTPGKEVSFRFLDTEKDNPRTSSVKFEQNIGYGIHSHFVPHGEAMLPIIEWCKNASDIIILIDEPDSGILLKNQKVIFRVLKKAEANGCQIIITTHSYVLIKSAKIVYSLDTKQWVSSDEYLERTLGKTWVNKKISAK